MQRHRPVLPGYELCDCCQPTHTGRDYFDYIMLPSGAAVAAVGDVAAKGGSAASLVDKLSSCVQHHLLTKPTVSEALSGVNAELASDGLGHQFITCVVTVLDPRQHELRIANAGHLPPIVRRARRN